MLKLHIFVVLTLVMLMTLDPVAAKEGKPIDPSGQAPKRRRSRGAPAPPPADPAEDQAKLDEEKRAQE